jgi:hypothetical protein
MRSFGSAITKAIAGVEKRRLGFVDLVHAKQMSKVQTSM